MTGAFKVYVDSSFRSKDGCCQTGYTYNHPKTRKLICGSTEVFYCSNNNDAELLGIFTIIKQINDEYGIKNFIVYNDSVIGCSMLKPNIKISKKVKKHHPVLLCIREYFEENGIKVRMVQLPRSDKRMKTCDRLSKAFRKGKGRNGHTKIQE